MNPKTLILVFLLFLNSFRIAAQTNITFQISAKQDWDIPSSGRMFIFLSKSEKVEPRFSVNPEEPNKTGMLFGKDVYWNLKEPLLRASLASQ